MKINSTIFCLAGMHRSGTSLMANWFHASDIFIGKELLGPASSNKNGHFEDINFLDLHAGDLIDKGYHNSGLFLDDKAFRLEKKWISKVHKILSEREDQAVWGWKEPRSTLYIFQWKELIPQLKVIGIYREPSLVVESLYTRFKRNKWYKTKNPIKRICWWVDIDLNPRKWKAIFWDTYDRYNREIIDFQKIYPEDTIIIELADIIKHPVEASDLICDFLKLNDKFIEFNSVFEKQNLNVGKIKKYGLKSETYNIMRSISHKFAS